MNIKFNIRKLDPLGLHTIVSYYSNRSKTKLISSLLADKFLYF